MNTKHLLIAALLAGPVLSAPALAWQGEAVDIDAPEQTPGDGPPTPPFGHELMRPGPGKTVRNAPYSADAINDYQQTLADGNQITSRRSTRSYRDSTGRMRHEVLNEQGGLRNVTIVDPNQGSTWVLRPDAKTALKLGAPRDIARLAADKARAHVAQVRGADGERIIIKPVERAAEREREREARGVLRDEVRIRVDRDMALRGMPMPGLERIGPAIAAAFGDVKYAARATVKDLGTREMEGVKAQGKLRSYEIPAGEIGNRNPIVVSDETWYAPELQVTIMARHSDPRSGERTYRLANIRREEPAAALFAVPSDYTVRDPMRGAAPAR